MSAVNIHLAELERRHPVLVVCRAAIEAAIDLLTTCLQREGTLLLCGNGGSAADAEHWAGELLKGFELRRPWRRDEPLPPELRRHLQPGLRAIPLSGFTSLRSAVANDLDPAWDYAQLVLALGRPGDVLIGLSTSGNAANVLNAAHVARARGLAVLALTGMDGGALAGLADCAIRAPATGPAPVQEHHLPIYHALCRALEHRCFDLD